MPDAEKARTVSRLSPPLRLGRWSWPVKAGLSVLVGWLILRSVGMNLGALREVSLGTIPWNPALLVASCLALAAGYLVSSLLWGGMVHALGGPRLRRMSTLRIFLLANLGRYIPGKIWQLAGLAVMAEKAGVPPSVASAAAVLGQGIALLAALTVGLPAFSGGGAPDLPWWAVLTLVLGVVAATSPPVLRRGLSVGRRLLREGETDTPPLAPLFGVRWTGLYLIAWIIYSAAFGLLVSGMGVEGSYLYISSSFAAAYLIGYIAIIRPCGRSGQRGGVGGVSRAGRRGRHGTRHRHRRKVVDDGGRSHTRGFARSDSRGGSVGACLIRSRESR